MADRSQAQNARSSHPFDYGRNDGSKGRKRSRSVPARRSLEGIPSCKLYVNGISVETNSYHLKRHFDQCGRVSAVDVPFDSVTRKSKGYAFVTYFHPEDAARALQQLHGTHINGKAINISPSITSSSNGSSAAFQADFTYGPRSSGVRSSVHRSGGRWGDDQHPSSCLPSYAAGDLRSGRTRSQYTHQAPVTGPALSWAPESNSSRAPAPPPTRQPPALPATAVMATPLAVMAIPSEAATLVPKHQHDAAGCYSSRCAAPGRLTAPERSADSSQQHRDSRVSHGGKPHDANRSVGPARGSRGGAVKAAVMTGSTAAAAADESSSRATSTPTAATAAAAAADATRKPALGQRPSADKPTAANVHPRVDCGKQSQFKGTEDKEQGNTKAAHSSKEQQFYSNIKGGAGSNLQQNHQQKMIPMEHSDDMSVPDQQEQQQKQHFEEPEDGEISSGYMVHISEMGPETTASDLRGFLSRAGVVTNAEVKAELTGVGEFETAKEAETAINMLSGAAVWNKIVTITPLNF